MEDGRGCIHANTEWLMGKWRVCASSVDEADCCVK